jgi:hypothetical protein
MMTNKKVLNGDESQNCIYGWMISNGLPKPCIINLTSKKIIYIDESEKVSDKYMNGTIVHRPSFLDNKK